MDSVLAVTIKIEISICSFISRQISYPLLPGSIKSGKTHSYSTTFCDKCNITRLNISVIHLSAGLFPTDFSLLLLYTLCQP